MVDVLADSFVDFDHAGDLNFAPEARHSSSVLSPNRCAL